MPAEDMTENTVEISGTVESITFHNEANGFTVFEFSSEDEIFTAVGTFYSLCAGEDMTLHGEWSYHSNFGRQFKVTAGERRVPGSAAALLKYLSSGAIKGIGPSTALKIVEKFGDKAFQIFEEEPLRLTAIKGISTAKAMQYADEFKKQFAVREAIVSLGNFGLSPSECIKVYKLFGKNSFERVSENPYVLCSDEINIGFMRVDEIAPKINSNYSESRLPAGIIFVIKHNMNNGHTCIPRDKLILPCKELLGASDDQIETAIDDLIEKKQLVEVSYGNKSFVYLTKAYDAEKSAAARLKMLKRFPPVCASAPESEIELAEEELSIKYEALQRLAISEALSKGIVILTGGPGTGKTTTLNGIIRIMERQGLGVTLCAPTGRAAKRMSEVTGREAKTIHRLLEAEWDGEGAHRFSRNERNPLDTDVVIIDEISMVDIFLFNSVLEALPLGCRLVLVGDSNQLPSVGPGNVLHDLIESEAFPVIKLNEIFRQSENSMIISNAHKIITGEMPELKKRDGDFFHLETVNQKSALNTVISLCCDRLPAAYGFSPLFDIQVLCPSKKGELGTVSLNKLLQAKLNPKDFGKEEIEQGGRVFRKGDKVMQITNNYDIMWEKPEGSSGSGIFNGDIGIIEKIDLQENCMYIKYDDKTATHPFESLNELQHAYAVTVHKSQGSEFEAVIIPTLFVPPQLCYRNLFYTAVTRAKKLLITVGSESTIQKMVSGISRSKRYTSLQYFMKEDI